MLERPLFVVAEPHRTTCGHFARALDKHGDLKFLAIGTRRGVTGVRTERTRLKPAIGLVAYAGARLLPPFYAESWRFRLLPWFDHWVAKQLRPGDHVISSYGYANRCFIFARKHGGRTFIDAGNSHLENFWETLTEEHRRWKCPYPPISPFWYERSRAMLREVDYVLSPSSFVTQSFLARGFKPEQILRNIYPVDLSTFQPDAASRPKNRPLTIINTGSLSLRKGTPYLLEAFRRVRQRHPSARLQLTRVIQDDVKPVLARYSDLPIDWSPSLPHEKLAERLRGADVFVLPSLEEGLARTVCEALACGLPAVVTPNTGANDLVQPGINGEVVPIRDPQAIAEAILKCAERVLTSTEPPQRRFDAAEVSFERFEETFLGQLRRLGLLDPEVLGARP
jgi:alpha-maltose-1-phosphate synthase